MDLIGVGVGQVSSIHRSQACDETHGYGHVLGYGFLGICLEPQQYVGVQTPTVLEFNALEEVKDTVAAKGIGSRAHAAENAQYHVHKFVEVDRASDWILIDLSRSLQGA